MTKKFKVLSRFFIVLTLLLLLSFVQHVSALGISPVKTITYLQENQPHVIRFSVTTASRSINITVSTNVTWAVPDVSSFSLPSWSSRYVYVYISPLPAGDYVFSFSAITGTVILTSYHYVYVGPLPATVEINPETLNLKSNGEWITTYITFEDGYDVYSVDASSITINNTISAVWSDIQNEILMVKFNRTEVINWLGVIDYSIDTGNTYNVSLALTGGIDGVSLGFRGIDGIKVISKG